MALCRPLVGTGLDRHPMELDLVAESEDGRTLLVGECKLSAGEEERRRLLSALEQKAENLPFRSRYQTVRTQIFVAK